MITMIPRAATRVSRPIASAAPPRVSPQATSICTTLGMSAFGPIQLVPQPLSGLTFCTPWKMKITANPRRSTSGANVLRARFPIAWPPITIGDGRHYGSRDCLMSSLHDQNPLGRFTGLADTYARHRPNYPETALDLILAQTGLSAGS